MLISGGFAEECLQTIAKGVLDPRSPGQRNMRTVEHIWSQNFSERDVGSGWRRGGMTEDMYVCEGAMFSAAYYRVSRVT
jgi:hypothetical protein